LRDKNDVTRSQLGNRRQICYKINARFDSGHFLDFLYMVYHAKHILIVSGSDTS
jgi:hypothetical protein